MPSTSFSRYTKSKRAKQADRWFTVGLLAACIGIAVLWFLSAPPYAQALITLSLPAITALNLCIIWLVKPGDYSGRFDAIVRALSRFYDNAPGWISLGVPLLWSVWPAWVVWHGVQVAFTNQPTLTALSGVVLGAGVVYAMWLWLREWWNNRRSRKAAQAEPAQQAPPNPNGSDDYIARLSALNDQERDLRRMMNDEHTQS